MPGGFLFFIVLSSALARTNIHLHLALTSRVVPVAPQNMDVARTERKWLMAQMGRVVLDAKLQSMAVVLTTSRQLLDQAQRAVVVQDHYMAAAQMDWLKQLGRTLKAARYFDSRPWVATSVTGEARRGMPPG